MKWNRVAAWLLAGILGVAGAIVALRGSSYAAQDRDALLSGSSTSHPAGTDSLGRDRMVRVAVAMLIGFGGAVAAAALTTVAAGIVGTVAALGGAGIGWLTLLICDVFLALPWLFLLMMVRSALPLTTSPANSAAITFLILASLGWPACARAVNRGVRKLLVSDWMLQVRAGGLGRKQMIRHIAPNLMPLLLPQFMISVPAFIIAEANLGALGLGIAEPLPSWGGMLFELDNSPMLFQTRWVYLPVGLLVIVLFLLEAMVVED